jgi:hypothetical protein
MLTLHKLDYFRVAANRPGSKREPPLIGGETCLLRTGDKLNLPKFALLTQDGYVNYGVCRMPSVRESPRTCPTVSLIRHELHETWIPS